MSYFYQQFKKILVTLIILFWNVNLYSDHTSEHNIVVTCQVNANGLDVGGLNIRFNKDRVALNWLDMSKIVNIYNQQPGSADHRVIDLISYYTSGEDTDNWNDFMKNHRPVAFVNFTKRNWVNKSKVDTTLTAETIKFKDSNNPVNKKLSAVIYLDRIDAVGKIILRMDYDPKIRFPSMGYSSGERYFELETYLLEYCKLNTKKF